MVEGATALLVVRCCAQCGKPMTRRRDESAEQFARRLCCSYRCKRAPAARLLAEPRCECGAPATRLARFVQFSAQMHTLCAELPVCERCGALMADEDRGVTLATLEVARPAE